MWDNSARKRVHRSAVTVSVAEENRNLTHLVSLVLFYRVLFGSLLEVFRLACILLETLFTAAVGSLILLSVNRSLCTMEMFVN